MLTGNWQRLFSTDALAPEEVAMRGKWIETLLIPLAAIGLAWLTRPDDPLVADTAFPWLWFAPALVALRYGVLAGLVAGTLILGDWLAGNLLGAIHTDFPREFFFGGGLLILLCGEFSDVWRDRNMRMEETNLYVSERLSRLTKRHLLLNLSHDRLEQEMLARPGSLRDALARLRDIASEGADKPLPGGDGLLQLLVQYVGIESATLYTVIPEGGRVTLGKAVEEIGEPSPLDAGDSLLELALEKRSLVHVASEEVLLERESNQLVVAPLIASDDEIVGVLAVTKLPFFSLNVENLQTLAVVLGYYSDQLHAGPELRRLRERMPEMPPVYAGEVARMLRMQHTVGIDSQIVVLILKGPQRDEIPAQFLRVKRGLDLYWQTVVDGNPAVVVLMPFASTAAREGFVQRVEDWLKNRFGGDFDSLRVDVRSVALADDSPVETLMEMLRK